MAAHLQLRPCQGSAMVATVHCTVYCTAVHCTHHRGPRRVTRAHADCPDTNQALGTRTCGQLTIYNGDKHTFNNSTAGDDTDTALHQQSGHKVNFLCLTA